MGASKIVEYFKSLDIPEDIYSKDPESFLIESHKGQRDQIKLLFTAQSEAWESLREHVVAEVNRDYMSKDQLRKMTVLELANLLHTNYEY